MPACANTAPRHVSHMTCTIPHKPISASGYIKARTCVAMGEGLGVADDVLASLAALGIAPSLRDQVQQALSQLAEAAHVAAGTRDACEERQLSGAAATTAPRGTATAREAALQKRVSELESKLNDLEHKMGLSR